MGPTGEFAFLFWDEKGKQAKRQSAREAIMAGGMSEERIKYHPPHFVCFCACMGSPSSSFFSFFFSFGL